MFRSQSKSKSLKVQRETVRVLSASALESAQGGTFQGATAACEIATRQATCPNPQLSGGQGTGQSLTAAGGCGQIEITTGVGLPVSRLP